MVIHLFTLRLLSRAMEKKRARMLIIGIFFPCVCVAPSFRGRVRSARPPLTHITTQPRLTSAYSGAKPAVYTSRNEPLFILIINRE
jgi:hypothetical protein